VELHNTPRSAELSTYTQPEKCFFFLALSIVQLLVAAKVVLKVLKVGFGVDVLFKRQSQNTLTSNTDYRSIQGLKAVKVPMMLISFSTGQNPCTRTRVSTMIRVTPRSLAREPTTPSGESVWARPSKCNVLDAASTSLVFFAPLASFNLGVSIDVQFAATAIGMS
jgi:hypothetical protein